jgi:predicted transposase YbfD/YdcC
MLAQRFAAIVKTNWSAENNRHGQVDVTFQEDKSRIRKGHAHAILNGLGRNPLSLKNESTLKVGGKEQTTRRRLG